MLRDESRPGGGSNRWLCGVGGAWMSLAVSVLLTTTAFAQNPHVYVSGGGIYIMPQDAEVSRPLLFREGGSIELHSALGGLGGVGIDWGGGIRTELEYGRRQLELGKLNTRLAVTGRPFELELDGDLTTDLLMANLLYVFQTRRQAGDFMGRRQCLCRGRGRRGVACAQRPQCCEFTRQCCGLSGHGGIEL